MSIIQPFYAKGPGNAGYIKNMEVLAFHDLEGGMIMQPQIYKTPDGHYYLYGTDFDSVDILEITDISHPRFVKKFKTVPEGYPTTDNPKIQIADGRMIISMCSGSGPSFRIFSDIDENTKFMNGICIYSIAEDPENPQFLSYWDNGVPFAMGVHRFTYTGGNYVHTSSDAPGFEGMIYRIIDISDPKHPKEAGRWWKPEQFADGYPGRTYDPHALHCPEFMDKPWLHFPYVIGNRAYLSYSGAGLYILDISDVTRPQCIGHLDICPPFGSELAGARTHTALPFVKRGLCVVDNEGERYVWFEKKDPRLDRAQALNNIHMIDIHDPAHPVLIAEFPYPEVPEGFPYRNFTEAYLEKAGPFGPHNLHEPMEHKPLENRDDRVYCAYTTAGLRVYDISDPYYIKEIGYFIPPTPTAPHPRPGGDMAIAEDVIVDDRGNIILCTNADGIYILRMKE